MGSFFKDISKRNALPNWPDVFDWLLDDDRFQGTCWSKKAKASFTEEVRKLNGMGTTTFNRKSKALKYPVFATKRNRKKKPFAVISSSGSLGVDFVQHIRNGIAHGNVELYIANKIEYVEIKDYGRNGSQTGYIAIPVSYLSELLHIYLEVEAGLQDED